MPEKPFTLSTLDLVPPEQQQPPVASALTPAAPTYGYRYRNFKLEPAEYKSRADYEQARVLNGD